jgi:plasmid maintenance system antidote protein VapI
MAPDQVLRNAVLASGMSVNAVARAAHVPQSALDKFVRKAGTITPPTAMRLMGGPGLELRPREGAAEASR